MQGQRSSVSALPENLSFDHGSTSSDAAIDPQVSWPSETNSQFLHHTRPEGLNGEWSFGESSSHSRSNRNERKREHTWSIHSRPAINLEECQHESSDTLSLDTVSVNEHGNERENGRSVLQISGPGSLPQDLNMCSEFDNVRSSNEKMPSTVMEESDYGPGCSLDGRRISCKRKALEIHVGQSSGGGSSNNESNVSASTQVEHNVDFSNGPEGANLGARLGIGGPVLPNPFSLRTADSSHRNFRLRINGSYHQDPVIPFSTEANVGNSDVSSSWHSSRLLLRNRLFDLNPTPPSENGTHHSQSGLLHVPSLRRNPQSRWSSGASTSRIINSSASAISVEREGDPMLLEESRNIPSSIPEHPMFAPNYEIGSSSEQPTNWNVASTSRAGPASGVNLSSPALAHRSYPNYPRRLSEIVQRSLLSSVGTESGGQSSNLAIRSGASQEMEPSSGSGNHVRPSRSALLERHLDGAVGMPYSLRSLAAAGEGRSSIMSEIRHVLDRMRRGDGLRIEDMMILDHSVFFGMADVFDRHRDMRMDVDNMSYEELLALGERIGNVCTGLNEETIISRLQQRKYSKTRAKDETETEPKDETETEPCSICREEYNNGEDLGTLECGHDFHRDCIKQWLMHKNLCPICKMTGLPK